MKKTICAALLAAVMTITPIQIDIFADEETEIETRTEAASILNLEVIQDDKPVDAWYKSDAATIRILLKSSQIITKDVTDSEPGKDPKGIVIDRLSDGFTAGDTPEITLDSNADEPLKLTVLFPNVKWKGKDDLFEFMLEAGNIQEKLEARIYEVKEKEPEPEPEPVPETGTIDPGWSGDPVKIASPTPNLIVTKYNYGKSVAAGTDFNLELEFKNTSNSLSVENIVLSADPEGGLSIAEGSNSFYYESMGAGKTKKLKLKMHAVLPESGLNPALNLNFSYEYVDDGQRLSKTSTEKITIPVTERDRMEITEAEITEPAYAGQEYTISFPFVNKGKGTLYNVSMKAEGKGFTTLVPVQNLGNFESGRSGTLDMVLIPDEPGQLKVKVIITYENGDEKETKKEYDVTLDVLEYVPEEPVMPAADEDNGHMGWILGIVGIGAAAAIFFWYKKKKKGKKTGEEQDLTSLFDDKDDQ